VGHSEDVDAERGLRDRQPVELPLQPIILQDGADVSVEDLHPHGQSAVDNSAAAAALPPNEFELDSIEQVRRESIDLRVNPIGMKKALFTLHTTYQKLCQRYELVETQKMAAGQKGNPAVESAVCDECTICLVKFKDSDQVVPLECNTDHVYHVNCLMHWANHNYTCPVCRQPIIKSQKEIKLY